MHETELWLQQRLENALENDGEAGANMANAGMQFHHIKLTVDVTATILQQFHCVYLKAMLCSSAQLILIDSTLQLIKLKPSAFNGIYPNNNTVLNTGFTNY